MTRLIDADKLYPDCLTKNGTLAISQSQIANAPTVDTTFKEVVAYECGQKSVERPQGEWINREAISNTIFPFWERYECNQCHKFNGYSNYCPNCGSDMRKEAENE